MSSGHVIHSVFPIYTSHYIQGSFLFQTKPIVHVSFHMHLQCAMECDVQEDCNMFIYINNDCHWGRFANESGPGITEFTAPETMRYWLIPSRVP